jgi:hypothetical protein
MKIKLTETQLTSYFKEVFNEGEVYPCGEVISESLSPTDKSEIKSIVKKEIKDFLDLNRSGDLEKKVEDIIKKRFKNDKDIEKHIVEITKNVLVQLYKSLWTKRNFWSGDLKNLPS